MRRWPSWEPAPEPSGVSRQGKKKEEFNLRIILIQRYFPGQQKANIGLIAREVTRLFFSDPAGMRQILETLNAPEIDAFKRMDADQQISWLMKKWGFQEELEALRNEAAKLQTPASK